MWLKQWLQTWRARAARGGRKSSPRQARRRPTLERLEDRNLPSSFTPIGVSHLVADVHAGAHTVVATAMKAGGKHDGHGGPGDPSSGGL
jgi:hypothetical protein